MRIITVCLSLLAIFALMSGCMTAEYSVLSSQSVMSAASSVNPSLSLPDKGLHPYASASFSDKSNTDDREVSIEELRMGTLTVGVNYHKALEKRIEFFPFIGGSVSGSIMSYSPRFLENEYSAIQSRSIDFESELTDYTVEFQVKPGLLIKLNKFLVSVYVVGICRYEDGAFTSLRKKLDGIERMYNIADNPWSYGFSLGEDIQVGSPGKFDFGLNFETTVMYNRTQSVSVDYLRGDTDVPSIDGGSACSTLSFAITPYLDYRHWRVSLSVGTSDIATVCVTMMM